MAETQTTTRTTETKTEEKEKKSSLLTDILSVVGLAIVFIILIWGLVHLASLAGTSLSSWFSHPAPSIQVSAPAQAYSGETVTVSWKYSPNESGSYAFLYACKNGLSFQTAGATSTVANIPCGVAYTLGNASDSVAITPRLSATSSLSEALSIIFIPSKGGSQVQGSATMTITPAPAQTTPTKPAATSKPAKSTPAAPRYTGPADLSVRIISQSVDQNGNAVVSFDIANVGGSTSGSYYFTAQLPTAQPYPYTSAQQSPLASGAHIVDTLRFNEVQSGTFSVTVQGGDSNTANNYASAQITGSYYSSYNPTQYTVYPSYSY